MGIISAIQSPIRPAIVSPLGGIPSSCRAHWVPVNGVMVDQTGLTGYRVYTNKCINGFPDDTTGWLHFGGYSSESVVGGWLRSTKASTKPYPGRQDSMGMASGNKIFVRIYARSNANSTVAFTFASANIGASNTGQVAFASTPTATKFTAIVTLTGAGNSFYIDGGTLTTDGDYLEIKEITIIDLTAMFGAGNEPSVTECDALFPFVASTGTAVYPHKGTTSGAVQQGQSLYFDGSDDYVSVQNSPWLDVTSAPLAVFATINSSNTNDGMIVCKNSAALTDAQYAILYDTGASTILSVYLSGTRQSQTDNYASKLVDKISNIGFIWNGTTVVTYVNGKIATLASGGTYSGTLASASNFRIGRRETAALSFKGNIYNVSIYAGNSFAADEILEHQRQFARSVGVTV